MKTLESDMDLFAAQIAQERVTVWSDKDVLIDYGGVIEKWTPNSVKINGAYFLRAVCTFKTSKVL